jgi:DNA-binding beta-propeller fold protein YncE
VINVSTNQTIGTIPISANSIAFSPDGTTAYIAGSQAGVGGVAVVDASTLAVTDFIAGANGSGAESIAVTPDGTYVYVGGSPGRVISTQTLQVVGQFQSSGPIAIY